MSAMNVLVLPATDFNLTLYRSEIINISAMNVLVLPATDFNHVLYKEIKR